MLKRLKVRNFQSLREADIELLPLTVVVGASNSGKSATLRALKVLVQNASSPGFVTVGETASTIELDYGDGLAWLERGKAQSTYVLSPGYGDEQKYPKAGTSVPDAVQVALRMPSDDDSPNFAGQFDRPYLLSDPATKVAKVLGDLTNITVIHEAVREANRRRLEAQGTEKLRKRDRADLAERIAEMGDVAGEGQRLDVAEAKMAELDQRLRALAQLEGAVATARVVAAQLKTLKAGAPPTVETQAVETRMVEVRRLRQLLRDLMGAAQLRTTATKAVGEWSVRAGDLRVVYDEELRAAGRCPTCGRETT